jgi:hypothetical protein
MLAKLVSVPQSTKLDHNGLALARRLFGLNLYELYDNNKGYYKGLAWTRSSFEALFNVDVIHRVATFNDEPSDFVRLRKYNLTKLKAQTEQLRVYILQRLLWPHKTFKVRTALEFECCYEVVVGDPELAAMCIIEPQKDILGYRADCLFRIRISVLNGVKVPDIVFEVNENGHVSYSQEDEAKRRKVIEAFGYRFISVDLKRSASHQEIVTAAAEARTKLKKVVSDLILQYTPNLTAEHFLQVAADNDIDRQLLHIYFPTGTHETEFFIPHEVVARYLEYETYEHETGGSKYFIELIKKKLTLHEDYEVLDGRPSKTS